MNLDDYFNDLNKEENGKGKKLNPGDLPEGMLESMKLSYELSVAAPLIESLAITVMAYKNVNALKEFIFMKSKIKERLNNNASVSAGIIISQNKENKKEMLIEFLAINDTVHIVDFYNSQEDAKNALVSDITTDMNVNDKIDFMLSISRKDVTEVLQNLNFKSDIMTYLQNKTERLFKQLKEINLNE